MIKIALAMIVKGDKEEAELLNRCLENVLPYVDKAFVTITHKKGEKRNKDVEEVCNVLNEEDFVIANGKKKILSEKNKIVISDFEWVNNFSAARNFNFSQVPVEYTHILWCDADDVFRGLERLAGILQKDSLRDKPVDGFGMWYLYHFDEYKQADVVHKKTMILRNPIETKWGHWMGELHEDFISNVNSPEITMIDKFFNGGIDRMHLIESEKHEEKVTRNVTISKKSFEDNPKEPRNFLNYAQSLHGSGKYKESEKIYQQFLKVSGSEEEKYIARLRISESRDRMNDREGSLESAYLALGMRPQYPDGYFALGNLLYKYGRLDDAELYYLMGLKMKPRYNSIIVYNPRDYDYNPMRMLIRLYQDKGRPDLGLPFMDACVQIYPNNNKLKDEYETLKKETKRLTEVVMKLKDYENMSDEALQKEIGSLPEDLRSHPGICALYNKRFIKTQSNGKELSIYCYPTAFDFNPELFEKTGFGGSEEAVINLSKELAELGWEVTVYNRCGPTPKKYGKVWYKPFWMWNHRDVVDVLILWRSPVPLGFDLAAKKVLLDLHDVVPVEEFTKQRLEKVHKIMVKTKAHRSLFPNIPDDKFAIIPNGQDNSLFKGNVKKDPYLLLNTSSPDRSMDSLPELFMEVKKQVPQARMIWAYGWKNYDDLFKGDSLRQKWKSDVEKQIKRSGIEAIGKVPQKEIAKYYEQATILAYPSEFFEIDCISVKKAQAAGCIPVTTDFAAFDESVQYGYKVHSKKNNNNWVKAYQFGFGITDKNMKKEWVQHCVNILKTGEDRRRIEAMKKWGKTFNWEIIAKKWNQIIK